MLGVDQFYAALKGQGAQDEAWRAQLDELLAQHPYCHMGHLLRALTLRDTDNGAKRKRERVLFSVAAQIPGSLALHNTLEHGAVLIPPIMPPPRVDESSPTQCAPASTTTVDTQSFPPQTTAFTESTTSWDVAQPVTPTEEAPTYEWATSAETSTFAAPEPFAEWPVTTTEEAYTPPPAEEPVGSITEWSFTQTPLAELTEPSAFAPTDTAPSFTTEPIQTEPSGLDLDFTPTQEAAPSPEAEAVELGWDTLPAIDESESVSTTSETTAAEPSSLASVLDDALAVDVPGPAPSIFPFAESTGHLAHEDMDFVTTILNPLYQEAAAKAQSQNEAIEAYLDNLDDLVEKLRNIASSDDYSTENAEDLAKESSIMSPAISSERLAQMHVERGEIALAIAMYQRLAVSNPEKSAYFAGIIEGLQGKGEAQ